MSVKKTSGEKIGIAKNIKKLEATTNKAKYDPPETPVKTYKEDGLEFKKIPNDSDEVSNYAPEYTGNLFLGSLNNLSAVGLSAYQIAVENGFVGTEQEWVDSLVGPAGPAGSEPPLESKDLVYDGDDNLYQVISISGTKTLTYNLDGSLNTVSNTKGNVLKTMVYNVDGELDEVQVSFF